MALLCMPGRVLQQDNVGQYHSREPEKEKALSVPNTINNFIRIAFWQKCVCEHVNQCPLTATLVRGSVCVGEGRKEGGEEHTVIKTQGCIVNVI